MNGPRVLGARGNGERSGRLQLGAVALFLPATLLLVFALWQRQRGLDGPLGLEAPTEPERTAVSGPVACWTGRLERPSGSSLALRLETLHPFSSRQTFDAAALAARFRGGDPEELLRAAESSRDPEITRRIVAGPQPWRLSIVASASAAAPSGEASTADKDPTDAERPRGRAEHLAGLRPDVPFASVVIDDLSKIRIDGLEPLVRDADGARGEASTGPPRAHDPLRTLLRFPASDLREGETCDLIFWGNPPSGTLRVHVPGVHVPGGASDAEVVELRPMSRAPSRASEAIARLDARAAEGPR